MMLSDDKISHLSHVLLKGLLDGDIIGLNADEGKIRREIKRSMVSFLKVGQDIDESVRKKMQSFSRKIIEGTPEWEVLYKKFYKEEAARRGVASE
ncbi:MAG TPA: DUF507 domain-containing protein [Nitrospiraceae bacterium]|nr:DUF507 domain-containing protein [Nitrospiraceae bacterium]